MQPFIAKLNIAYHACAPPPTPQDPVLVKERDALRAELAEAKERLAKVQVGAAGMAARARRAPEHGVGGWQVKGSAERTLVAAAAHKEFGGGWGNQLQHAIMLGPFVSMSFSACFTVEPLCACGSHMLSCERLKCAQADARLPASVCACVSVCVTRPLSP